MKPQDLVSSWFSGAAGDNVAGQRSGATIAPAPKAAGFASQVGHSIQTVVPAVAGAVGHAIADPFTHLFGNNVSALRQGGVASGIDGRRAALDAQSNATLKAYSAGHITKDQFRQQSKAQMKAYQDLQQEAQGNIDSVKSTAQMLPDALSAAGTVATLGAGGLELGGVKAGAEALGARVAGKAGAKVAGKVVQGVSDTIGAGKGMGPNVVTQLPGKIIRNAVVTQPTLQFAGQAVQDAKAGKLPALAGDAALAAAPAGIALGIKGAKAVLPGIKDALHGTSATLTDALGVNRVKQFLAENANNPDAINSLKRMELFTKNQPAVVAGKIAPGAKLAEHLLSIGVDPKTASVADIVKQFDAYARAHGTLEAAKATSAAQVAEVLAKNKVARAEAKAINAEALAKAGQKQTIVPAEANAAMTKSAPSKDLPKELSGAKPNYNYGSKSYQLAFKDGVTKALYIVAGKNPSKSEGQYMMFLRSHFPGESDVQLKARGQAVRASIKEGAAKGEGGTLTLGQHPAAVTPHDLSKPLPTSSATTIPAPNVSEPIPTVKPNLVEVPKAIHPDAVVSADFRKAIPEVVSELKKLGENPTGAEKAAAVDRALSHLGNINETVRTQIAAALTELGSGPQMASKLKPIVQKYVINHPGIKLPSGFIATEGPKVRATMPTIAEAAKAGLPEVGANPSAVLGRIGTGLKKAGLGLQTTAPGTTQGLIKENLNKRLEGTDFAGKGKDIMTILHDATSKTRGVFDPRLLRATTAGLVPGAVNIEHELGVSAPEAKMILKAVKGAYGDIRLGDRSLGEKLTDKAVQHVPGMATFLKAQGYGKYSLNPFFWAKQATKGEFIGQAEAGGKALNVGRTLNHMLGTAPKEGTMKALRSSGLFSKGNMAGGESDFFGNLAPELGAQVSGPEVSGYIQQSMGQAAEQFAKNNGTTVGDILKPGEDGKDHALKGEFDHLMQMVVGYPKGSNALNSNLMKSLNVLVFPSRFELKVATAAAHYFVHQPKVVQLAMINSTLKANAWAGSPEGKQWQKDNADLMGIINYFSPTHSIDAVLNFAKTGNAGDLGQIGGLPFGVVTTILKNQGVKLPVQVTGNDTNPATGEAYVQKLPNTDKARIQQGITDLIGQMFAYPGATIGAQSKSSLIQGLPGLKINPKEQTKTGPAKTATAPKVAPLPTFNRANVKDMNLQKANVTPIYKSGSARAKKGKTLARLPGTF